jgi:hypothetical protein
LAALLSCSGLSFEHCQFNLIRKGREMVGEPIKHLALGWFRCEVADKSAFSRVFAEFLDSRQIVLHRDPAFAFPIFDTGTTESN